MPDRFPPLAPPAPIQRRIGALPAPSLPWFELVLMLAMLALARHA